MMKFRIIETYGGTFWVQKRPAWFPFWMYAWENNMYRSLEKAQAALEDYKKRRSFKNRVVG